MAGSIREREGKKCNMDTLRWCIRIKDTRKTKKRLFLVENGKRRKVNTVSEWIYKRRGINKLDFRQKSLSTLVKLKHDIKKHLNCLNFN